MNSPNDNLFLSSEEELRAVVQRAKFMVPTTRRKVEKEEVGDSVSQGTEGDVVVTGVSTRSTVTTCQFSQGHCPLVYAFLSRSPSITALPHTTGMIGQEYLFYK